MPDTTPQQEPIRFTCGTCRAAIDLLPAAVTVNVPQLTAQFACAHCSHITTKRVSCKAVLASLLGVGVPFVPQGDGARLEADVMAARIYLADPVPAWPVGSDL